MSYSILCKAQNEQTAPPPPPLPEELVNAGLAERALEQGELHLAGVDGCHGGVAEPSDAQRRLQLHLSTSLSPQPARERIKLH